MAPDPEGILKTLMPTKDDWRLLVGGVGSLNAGWLNAHISNLVDKEHKYAPELLGAIASYGGYKLLPVYLKGTLGEGLKVFCLGCLFSNLGQVAKEHFPQIAFEIKPPAGGMPERAAPEAPTAPPAPQTVEELAALEAQISSAKYFGR